MGVRGLQTFIEQKGYTKIVNIEEEIRLWRRWNPNQDPTIVFDIMGLTYTDKELLFGNRTNDFNEMVEEFFIRLTKNGVKLIFVQDLAVEVARVDLLTERKNSVFQTISRIYKMMRIESMLKFLFELEFRSEWTDDLALIASKHGQYFYARAGRDCDYEVASYAKKYNAMAVFTVDTDFLIFEGKWKFWNLKNLDLKSFTTKEYNRLAILRLLSLYPRQRPLLATLMGNDYTHKYYDDLYRFHRSLGRPHERFRNVANFIRRNIRNVVLSTEDIDFITAQVFGRNAERDKYDLIRDSIDSYNLRLQTEENLESDPIETKLATLSVKAVRSYRELNIDSIQTISVPFNDMATPECSEILIEFLEKLLRKRMGTMCHDVSSEKTFKILKKMSRSESFATYDVTPIPPDFPMPVLADLLTKDDSDDELNETRWKLLAWMLSISDEHRDSLRSMDRKFRVTCATLLALVQRNIISIKAADGILITESAATSKQAHRMPKKVQISFVRAAHIYHAVHSAIKYAFITAGLFSSILDLFIFDGIYYHNLMAYEEFPPDLFGQIRPYRIYVSQNTDNTYTIIKA